MIFLFLPHTKPSMGERNFPCSGWLVWLFTDNLYRWKNKWKHICLWSYKITQWFQKTRLVSYDPLNNSTPPHPTPRQQWLRTRGEFFKPQQWQSPTTSVLSLTKLHFYYYFIFNFQFEGGVNVKHIFCSQPCTGVQTCSTQATTRRKLSTPVEEKSFKVTHCLWNVTLGERAVT